MHGCRVQGQFLGTAFVPIFVPGAPNETFGSPLVTSQQAQCSDVCFDEGRNETFW